MLFQDQGIRQGCLLLPLLINIVSEVLVRQENQVRGINLRKEELKLSFFVVNRIFYMENHKESTKNIIELTAEFNKDAEYKINI